MTVGPRRTAYFSLIFPPPTAKLRFSITSHEHKNVTWATITFDLQIVGTPGRIVNLTVEDQSRYTVVS